MNHEAHGWMHVLAVGLIVVGLVSSSKPNYMYHCMRNTDRYTIPTQYNKTHDTYKKLDLNQAGGNLSAETVKGLEMYILLISNH